MASPRSAAAVILIRETPALEVFWVRRAPQMSFQGGFHAFPGGQLDPDEDAKVCAARELLEETGARSIRNFYRRWPMVNTGVCAAAIRYVLLFSQSALRARNRTLQPANTILESGSVRPTRLPDGWKARSWWLPLSCTHCDALLWGLHDIETRMKASPWAHGEPTPEIEMRPGIVLVPLRTPTLPPATHTNCYVIGGDEVVVIDPASPYEEEQALLDRVLEKRKVREIWLTHLHRDHVGGANHLKERLGVPVAAHSITAKDLQGVVEIDRTFRENERLELMGKPGWSLQVLHTPGHARGHVCIFDARNGSLITGDLMAGSGTVVIDPPEGHMATYFESLRRMQALPVTALFPAHGPVMANAKARIQDYLDHRLDRERKILDAWQRGSREPGDIVQQVYTDVPAAMHELAQRSVMAHLEKLREERQI